MTELEDRIKSLQPFPCSMWIGGMDHVSHSSETMEILDPATGYLLANVQMGTPQDVDMAVAAARRAGRHGDGAG